MRSYIDLGSGPGGGGFMLVRNSDGVYEDIDFRETAPAAAFQDMYKDNVVSSIKTLCSTRNLPLERMAVSILA